MELADVVDLVALMDSLGVRIWLDGGWAVDACLGEQTRAHADLDIVVEERSLDAVVAALMARGYGPVPREDTSPWNFVLGDPAGREVDIHVIVLDAAGRGLYGPPEVDFVFPAASLQGSGTVGGRTVSCIAPEWLVRFHTGYEVDANDWADVSALCERFAIEIPEEYRRFGSPS
jgi:lincosamide nucleotidyltransferase A/C/D/E